MTRKIASLSLATAPKWIGGFSLGFTMAFASVSAAETRESTGLEASTSSEVDAVMAGVRADRPNNDLSLGGILYPHLHIFSAYG